MRFLDTFFFILQKAKKGILKRMKYLKKCKCPCNGWSNNIDTLKNCQPFFKAGSFGEKNIGWMTNPRNKHTFSLKRKPIKYLKSEQSTQIVHEHLHTGQLSRPFF